MILFSKRKKQRQIYLAEAERYVFHHYEDPEVIRAREAKAKSLLKPHYSIAFDKTLDSLPAERLQELGKKLNILTPEELSELLSTELDKTFSERVLELLTIKQLEPKDVYKAGHIDRKLMSKLLSDPNYSPSKDTVFAVGVGLKLDIYEMSDLFRRAGYAFSHSDKRDVVLEYFIRFHVYNMNDINHTLYKLDLKTVGRG